MNENLQAVRDLCLARRAEVEGHWNQMIDFAMHVDSTSVATERFNSFKVNHLNIVTFDGKPCMMVVDIPLRMGYRIAKMLALDDQVDPTSGVFYLISADSNVPCHRDEEVHKGYIRGQRMLTFNVSSPKSLFYVNSTGEEGQVSFGVTGFFSTVIVPTEIFHGIVAGPEVLILVQFPIKESTES